MSSLPDPSWPWVDLGDSAPRDSDSDGDGASPSGILKIVEGDEFENPDRL